MGDEVIISESRAQGFICAYCGTRFNFAFESNNVERIQAQIDHATVCPWNPVVRELEEARAELREANARLLETMGRMVEVSRRESEAQTELTRLKEANSTLAVEANAHFAANAHLMASKRASKPRGKSVSKSGGKVTIQ